MEDTRKSTHPTDDTEQDETREKTKLEAPDKCAGCGKTSENIGKEYGGYLVFRLPMPFIALFACPNCHTVMVNKNAFKLTQQLHERVEKKEKQRIIQINSPLTVPNYG